MNTHTDLTSRILVVVPVYNHGGSLRRVVEGVLALHPHVLVVDDGSTDLPASQSLKNPSTDTLTELVRTSFLPKDHPLHNMPILYARHFENRGKGVAILTAAAIARQRGMSHIVTIDADGQHDPQDLPLFFADIARDPLALFVGFRNFDTPNVPGSSRFGRSFSNFWFMVQTGEKIADSQCGYRSYPIAILDNIECNESRYSFEVEVLVRAAWAGFSVQDIPIRVYYPPKQERISHFKSIEDNIRISLLNTRLTIRAIAPVPHKKFVADSEGRVSPLHPLRSIKMLLIRNETPKRLAQAAALGVAIGVLPLIGIQVILMLFCAGSLRLNKFVVLAAGQLCVVPFVPALCIETGYYLRKGEFLTEISLQTLGYEALQRLWEWIFGSLLLAPLFALLVGALVFATARTVQWGIGNSRAR